MKTPKLKKSTSGTYYIHWSANRRSRRKSTGTSDLVAAQKALGTWLLENGAADSREEPTCGEIWALYIENIDRQAVDTATPRYSWRHLERTFATLKPSEVTQTIVDRYVRLRAAAAPATIRRELAALRACLSWAAHAKNRFIARTPAFSLPSDSEPRQRWLRKAELAKLLAACGTSERLSRVERFIHIAAATGARKTAICELTWDRVDFEQNVIELDVPGRKATRKRRATLPIADQLRPVLERAFAERKNEYVLDSTTDVWRQVRELAERAGVEGVSPHTFRHTAATHMARNGVPIMQAAGVLSVTTKTLERVYVKHAPDGLLVGVNSTISG